MNQYIAQMVTRYYQVQEHRLSIASQIREMKKRQENVEPFEYYFKQFREIEKNLSKFLGAEFKREPMYDYLKGVKGIGPILGCALLSSIDVQRAEHRSSIWKYCGLAPGQRRIAGKKLDYNPFMKSICWNIGESFVKCKGKYRGIYDTSKEFYQRKFPEPEQKMNEKGQPMLSRTGDKLMRYTPMHIHAMAKRRAVKIFLGDFWETWRRMEKLPVSVPFMHRGLEKSA